jgi:hypothetical protein
LRVVANETSAETSCDGYRASAERVRRRAVRRRVRGNVSVTAVARAGAMPALAMSRAGDDGLAVRS